MFRSFVMAMTLVMFATQPALPAPPVHDSGYRCYAGATGAYGLVHAEIYLDDFGKVTESTGHWELTGPEEWAAVTVGQPWKYNNPDIKLAFDRPSGDFSVPLRPASLSVTVTTAVPPSPTELSVTLSSGEQRRLPHVTPEFLYDLTVRSHWSGGVNGTGVVKEPDFLAAFIHASSLSVEVHQQDDTRIFHSDVAVQDADLALHELERLDAAVIADAADYQHDCAKIVVETTFMQ